MTQLFSDLAFEIGDEQQLFGRNAHFDTSSLSTSELIFKITAISDHYSVEDSDSFNYDPSFSTESSYETNEGSSTGEISSEETTSSSTDPLPYYSCLIIIHLISLIL